MKSSFQTILLVLFGVAFAGAIIVFSGLISFGSKDEAELGPHGSVTIWGILPQNLIQPYLDNFNIANNGYAITYVEHQAQNFDQDILVALANNTPPDLVLFSSEQLLKIKDKLYPIPYTAYTERLYRDTNIDGAQIFLGADGVVAFPLVVDPLVIYYNKDILAQARFVVPPKTWTNLQQIVPVLTKRDARNAITQSAIALGTADNVNHVRDIISALFLQTGNSIVSYNPQINSYKTALDQGAAGNGTLPVAQALEFYTSFSNTANANYSWNSGLPTSLAMFLSGRSAFYIGRASELFTIQAQNPNLNFDVIQLLQTGASARPITYGSFMGIGILKSGTNLTTAYAAANYMASSASIDALSKSLSLPPVRRDLLLVEQQNPYVAVFFNAALTAFAWPDPDEAKSEAVFRAMITNVTSGRTDATSAVYEAGRDIQSMIR